MSATKTIDDVIAAVSANPGVAVGLDAAALRVVWDALCGYAEETLLRRKSLVIPGFAHVLSQQVQSHLGTWNVRTSWIPSVQLLPAFTAAYRVSVSVGLSQAHVGATVPILLNGATLAEKAGLPRHAAMNAVKDLVREIGTAAAAGPLALDMGFALLDFAGHRMAVKWSQQFLDRFNEALGVSVEYSPAKVRRQQQQHAARPATAGASGQEARVPAPPTPRPPPTPAAPAEAAPKVPTPPPPAKVIPRPPAVPTPVPAAAPPVEAAARPSSSSRPSSARAPSASPRSRSGDHFASARRQHELAETLQHIPSHLTPYQKRKLRKSIYRLMRNRSYEESWEAQKAMQAATRAEEARKDRERVEAFRAFLAEQAVADREEAQRRREEEQQIQQLNRKLIDVREELRIPRAQPALDLFDSRKPTRLAPPDNQILLAQMAERKAREAREAAEDRARQQEIERQHREWVANQAREKEEKRRAEQALAMQYERDMESRESSRRAYKAAVEKCGAIFYGTDASADDEKREQREVKLRSRHFQEENRKLMQQNNASREAQKEQERVESARAEREFLLHNALLREQQKRERDAVSAGLRRSWNEQIDAKERERREEREYMRRYRETNFLKNESSDDES